MKRWIVCLLLAFLLTGCHREQPSVCRVVTRAQVLCHSGSNALYRSYSSQQDIGSLLTYLRMLDVDNLGGELPEDSEFSCKIILEDNLGGQTVYRQAGYGYLSKDNGPWKQIGSTQGSLLYPLLLLLPGDQ